MLKAELFSAAKDFSHLVIVEALQENQRQPQSRINSISVRNAAQLVSSDVESRHSLEQLDSFLSRTNENLRQPLTSIKIAVNLIKIALNQSAGLSPEQRRSKIALALKALDEECNRAIGLIDKYTASDLLKNSLRELAASDELLALHQLSAHCPKCASGEINKNGYRQGKQSYVCRSCGRQFL